VKHPRPTTNWDIQELRVCADRGIPLSAAARNLGMTHSQVSYWNDKAEIGLQHSESRNRLATLHPAPDLYAVWRLVQTMQRLKGGA